MTYSIRSQQPYLASVLVDVDGKKAIYIKVPEGY